MILRLIQASKNYTAEERTVHALTDVSLSVEKGEFIALVGRSGCGKSTLLNLAAAMDLPTSGEVWIEDLLTSSLNDATLTKVRRQKVGFIFQSFQLLPTLTVVENVELPLLLSGVKRAREKAVQQLSRVEMDAFVDRMPYQLSGGQMQRVAIARALVHSPRLLLADEPTGNVDSITGDIVLSLLKRITREHEVAIVMATHSSEAAATADRAIQMLDGRIL